MQDDKVREVITSLNQSREAALEIYNLMKVGDQIMPTISDPKKVAMSLPRYNAVVLAAELAVFLNLSESLYAAIGAITSGTGTVFVVSMKCARATWEATQGLIGDNLERLSRPIMGYTCGNLPAEEVKKDEDRVKATAEWVLKKLDSYDAKES